MVYHGVDTEEFMAVGRVSGTPYISADWKTDKKQCCHSAGLPLCIQSRVLVHRTTLPIQCLSLLRFTDTPRGKSSVTS